MKFERTHQDSHTQARAGVLTTEHSEIHTPVFMPVGTNATVKGLRNQDLEAAGAQIILSNTYHNEVRIGSEIIEELGGLHGMMNWNRSILTDSGGFQVFSLSSLRKITDEGVRFQSHLDGRKLDFTPENVVAIQARLGADIIMPLDQCIALPAEKTQIMESVNRTLKWLDRSLKAPRKKHQTLFGIVQGGTDPELRRRSALETVERNCEGYSIGGLSVGEDKRHMKESIEIVNAILPQEKPRYLMGVGTPLDILEAIARGVDMFDCVMPTRNARNGYLFVDEGHISIKKKVFAKDTSPLMEDCECFTCQHHPRAYLHHLYRANELLGLSLNSIHNIHYYINLTRKAREAIIENSFSQFLKDYREKSQSEAIKTKV